jgi:hypothetical protein
MQGLPSQTDDRFGHQLEPHLVLPVQYFSQRRDGVWGGEQRLMAAILEDAITIYSKPPPRASKARQILRETERWFRSNDRTWTFSFLRICEMLGLEPGAVRQTLRDRRDERTPRLPRLEIASLDEPLELPRRAAMG